MRKKLQQLWSAPAGYRQVLSIAAPLILSTGAITVQMFTDRVFLMWYSSQAMSAATYAGMVHFTILGLFLGTVTYTNALVAQYYGAERKNRVGASVWQGIYFAVFAGLIMALIAPLGGAIANWAGHEQSLRQYEAVYFKILCLGATPVLLLATLSCFYTGRGKTWAVMWVNLLAAALNVILDYALIFGRLGMPRWGVAGAAIATVLSSVVASAVLFVMFLSENNRQAFATLTARLPDWSLFARLIRFGLPCGVQLMLDVFGWALFTTFVGRINSESLAATSVVFQIYSLAFMPMLGFNTAVSTLVGQAMGKNLPELARKATWSAAYLTLTYMTLIALGYLFLPEIFLYPFAANATTLEFDAIRPLIRNLLFFAAFYSVFDTGSIIFSAALQGAGDTKFIMLVSVPLNWVILVIPTYIVVQTYTGFSALYFAWTAATAYICLLGILFFLRFTDGKWQQICVIEAIPAPIVHTTHRTPTP